MTNGFILFWTGVFGLIIGSFLNVVILRDNNRKSILTGRSQCPHCGHELSWYELIPVLSFLIQGAKCRKCRKPISWQYPLVELAMSALAVFALWYGVLQRGSWILGIGLAICFALLLVLSVIDIRTLEIPVEYALVAGVIGGLAFLLSHHLSLQNCLLGIAAGSLSLMTVFYGWKLFFKQEGMGSGDWWVAGSLGAIIGYPYIFIVLLTAVFAGALVGVAVLGFSKKGMQTALPFGPFLFLGLLITLQWGQTILHWYIL